MTASEGAIRVVVVDDDPDIRELLRMNLMGDPRFESAGEAANGAQAAELVADTEPDFVILDLDMPELDGLTAMGGIREAYREVKIVVFSARYDKYDANELLSNRADLYIDKARTVPELLQEIALLAAPSAT